MWGRRLKILFDVVLYESRQQSCAHHLLERFVVARIRRIRQEDDAPQIQRRLLRPADSVADVKERLKGTGHKSLAAFSSQEIDGLLGIAAENVLEDASFL